ncbi:hypothetical protein JZ751_028652 [Albula glossodonta]|uniref:G-protein coupled receptors family 1 profile domain-containing protein n=1 Tax=Albula glossodonta TaxID=121402 RepID=A0A8T2NIH5_9TELE|nr:hypothetical protein JZ751_028652 [Albula glossodonta]
MTDQKYISKLSPVTDYGTGAFLLVVVLEAARRRAPRLKPPELLSVNLALTDLGAAVSMYPLAIASAWSHRWVGGHPACVYYGLMGLLFGVASIATLTVMAVVRLVMTSVSHVPARWVPTWRRVWQAIVAVWFYALLWCLLPLIGWGSYGPEPFGMACSIAWADAHQTTHATAFVFLFLFLGVLLPMATITFSYARIAYVHHRAYRTLKNNGTITLSGRPAQRLTLMSVLVSVGFMTSWVPYAVVSMWSMFSSSEAIPLQVSLLPCLFAKASTVYNPLIYYAFSRTFRRQVHSLLPSCQPEHDAPDHLAAVHWNRGGHIQVLPLPCPHDPGSPGTPGRDIWDPQERIPVRGRPS